MKWYNLIGKKFGKLIVLGHGESRVVFNKLGKRSGTRKYWICICDCGNKKNVISASLISGKTVSCGCYRREIAKRLGQENPVWKGGRHYNDDGYVKVRDPIGSERRKPGYAFEHHLVMEKHLGRYLKKDETVHHKNGIKDDNRIQNLELWHSDHGKGHRVMDKIEYCLEFLKQYAPEYLK